MIKTIEHQFKDWMQYSIGYGYGTGEVYTLKALKEFLAAVHDDYMYRYQEVEDAVTPTVAWLLINILVEADIIEYGTSPRCAWLSVSGKELKKFVSERTVQQLYDICMGTSEDRDMYIYCCPEYCNCDPNDKEFKGPCIKGNVFWGSV